MRPRPPFTVQSWKGAAVPILTVLKSCASKEPRLFSRGKVMPQRAKARIDMSFNGATAFQPWKAEMQTGGVVCFATGFNGATAFQPWKDVSPVAGRPRQTCFNGATAFQPWKGIALCALWQRDSCASMEPRLFSRGKFPRQCHRWHEHAASMEPRLFSRGKAQTFVGGEFRRCASMEPRLFSRGKPSFRGSVTMMFISFNGATAFQPWKERKHLFSCDTVCSLQWSHGFSAVERV